MQATVPSVFADPVLDMPQISRKPQPLIHSCLRGAWARAVFGVGVAAVCIGVQAGDAQTRWKRVSDVLAVGLPLTAAGYSYAVEDREGLKQLSYSVGSSLLAVQALKAAIPVTRPDGSGDDSFPSGHTALAFAAARYMDVRYEGAYSPWLYGAAAATGMARVEGRKHRWGDVLMGAAIGWSAGHWFSRPREGQATRPMSLLSVLPTRDGWSLRLSSTW